MEVALVHKNNFIDYCPFEIHNSQIISHGKNKRISLQKLTVRQHFIQPWRFDFLCYFFVALDAMIEVDDILFKTITVNGLSLALL